MSTRTSEAKYCQFWGEGQGQCSLTEGHDGKHQYRRRFDHAYEPGAYQVCRRCGRSFDEHKQGYYIS